MTKRLIPKEVKRIVFKRKDSYNPRIGDFITKQIELDEISSVLDMNQKVIIKTDYLCDDLLEGKEYDFEITQEFVNKETYIMEDQTRVRKNMILNKIEIPTPTDKYNDSCLLVTYVFEKRNEKNEFKLDWEKQKIEKEYINSIIDNVVEKLGNKLNNTKILR